MSSRIDLSQDPTPGAGMLVPLDERPDTPQEAALQRRSRQESLPRLSEFLNKVCDDIDMLDDAERLRIRKSQVRCVMYYDGRQYGEVRDDGEWYDFDRSPGDIRPVDNEYKKQIDKLNMEMDRTRTEIIATAANPNDTSMVEAAKFAKARIDSNRTRMLTAGFAQSEHMALLLKTLTYRYTYFNPSAGPNQRRIPIIEENETDHKETPPLCAGCGMIKNPALIGQPCPNCGATKTVKLSAGKKNTVKAKEWQKGPTGRVETLHVDPLMVNVWLGARHGTGGHENGIASSPFLSVEQLLFRCQIEQHYPDRIIPGTGLGWAINDASRFAWDLERWPSNSGEGGILSRGDDVRGGGQMFERLRYRLYWLDPVVYSQFRCNYEENLPTGDKLPKGASLVEYADEGICVARVENTILDLYPEDKNRHWSAAPYGLREHAWHGSGTNALLGPQDTVNDLDSYIIANTYYNMAPREFVRATALEGGQLPAANEVAIVVNASEERDILPQVYGKAEPSSLPAEVFNFRESKRGSMQDAAGTSSLSSEGSAPDVRAMGTATGVAAIRDQAVGRMGPPLRLGASMDVEHAYQILELEQEAARQQSGYFNGLQTDLAVVEKGNLSYSRRGIEAFIACEDLRAEIQLEPAQGSWMPKTDAEVSSDYAAFGQVAAQAGAMLADPDEQRDLAEDMLARGAEVFRQPLQLGGWNATERAAAERLMAVARTVRVMERKGYAMPDPRLAEQAIAITPAAGVNVEMDNHPAFIRFYKEWFVSDEGRRASKLLKLTVETLKQQHDNGWAYQLAQDTKRDMAAKAPLLAAQEEEQQQKGQTTAQKVSESINYKDAPPSVRRQMEQQAGMQPATDDEHAAETQGMQPEGDDTNQQAALADQEARNKIAVQQHAADVQQDTETHKARLTIATQAHKAETDAELAREAHEREAERAMQEQATGRAEAIVERRHALADAETARKHEVEDQEKTREHETTLAKLKTPKATSKPKGGKK